jgi:hypothetical protein
MTSLLRRFGKLLRHPDVLRRRLEVAWDYFAFRRKYGFLKHGSNQNPKDICLIVSLTDWVTQAKMDGMLGKALQLRGVEPVVLTWRATKQAQLYFRAFGITKFIFLDDFLDQAESNVDKELPTRVLLERQSFKAFLDFSYKGVRVGNHVLSTVVRRLRKGEGGFLDENVQWLLKELLPRSLKTVDALEILFSKIKPRFLLFFEKGYSPYGEVFDAAVERNIPCIQYVHPHRPDALVFKRYSKSNRTLHPFSLSQKSWEHVKKLPWGDKENEAFMTELKNAYEQGTWFNRKYLLRGKKMKTPEEIRTQLKLDPKKKTAVVFSHVLWDATFFFGTTLFDDYEHWLVETVKAACKNEMVNWIIKLHPDYVWKMKQMRATGDVRDVIALQTQVGKLPPHVQIVMPDIDISTYSFFAITDWCITVRGTIGIEAPCFGIPVIVAGTGRYAGLGFTNDSQTAEEYLEKLRRIEQIPGLAPALTSLARKHARALFDMRPLPFTTFEMQQAKLRKVGKGLENNVVIRARSLEDIKNAADMNAFCDWILESTDEDYLRA